MPEKTYHLADDLHQVYATSEETAIDADFLETHFRVTDRLMHSITARLSWHRPRPEGNYVYLLYSTCLDEETHTVEFAVGRGEEEMTIYPGFTLDPDESIVQALLYWLAGLR